MIKADFNPIRKSSLTLVQTGCRQHPIPHCGCWPRSPVGERRAAHHPPHAAARAGERVRRTISEELAFLNLIQCKRCRKLTLRARIYVRCAEGALPSEPFYQACLIRLLHITTALTARTGCRCCAAMMGCALLCWGAISHKAEASCVSFPNQFRHNRGLFRWKHDPTTSVSY